MHFFLKHTHTHWNTPTVQQGDLEQCCLVFFQTSHFLFLILSLFCVWFLFLFFYASISSCAHTDETSQWAGGKPSKCICPSFIPLPRWHTCAGRRVVGVQWKRICKHSCLSNRCLHAHTHSQSGQQKANNKPSFSDVEPIGLEVDHWSLGGFVGCHTCSGTHTHAHTLVIFILASVSFHPATHFHLSALPLHIILFVFLFSALFW